ncbi:hypothetical protein BDV25DRAFT_113564 [Aspergillus avenaceus]|uniref:Uncharacterized protein n=1 Tax=Aspergillus avenaceus TaxID=36643 RepID=A0A5N6TV68_ASPAV|nr:hypothetical protein BDV25DRAFT_113564 [Aspergillus avenaceus]
MPSGVRNYWTISRADLTTHRWKFRFSDILRKNVSEFRDFCGNNEGLALTTIGLTVEISRVIERDNTSSKIQFKLHADEIIHSIEFIDEVIRLTEDFVDTGRNSDRLACKLKYGYETIPQHRIRERLPNGHASNGNLSRASTTPFRGAGPNGVEERPSDEMYSDDPPTPSLIGSVPTTDSSGLATPTYFSDVIYDI